MMVGGLTNSIFHSVFWQAKTQITNEKKNPSRLFLIKEVGQSTYQTALVSNGKAKKGP